jgi:hypothetical protein
MDALNALGITLDCSELVAQFIKLDADKQAAEEARLEIHYGKLFDNHILQYLRKAHPEWTLESTREEYVNNRKRGYCATLRLVCAIEDINVKYNIAANDKGQYVLTNSKAMNPLKTSKDAEKVLDAFDADVRNRRDIKKAAQTEDEQPIAKQDALTIKLGTDVKARKYSESVGHGSRYRTYAVRDFVVSIEKGESDYDSKYISFNEVGNNAISINKLHVGRITTEQFRQIIAILKK